MIFNLVLNAGSFRLSALLLAMFIALTADGASAQCWKTPAPETLEEAFRTSAGNDARRRQARAEQRELANAVLFISNGALKVAYSAGLLVGWGQAGERPRFAAITAVGTSALIAPFLFIGQAGDQAVADIFNCDAKDLGEVAERAASLLDDSVLAAIAREHDAGRRLFVGLPGSAARAETVWDIGLLAKGQAPGALTLAKDILRAAIILHRPVASGDGEKDFMQTFPQNPAFRADGTGQEFLLPPQLVSSAGAGMRYFLIHNDRLFWEESAEYIRIRNAKAGSDAPASALMPGYDVVRQALAAKGGFRFASPKTASGLVPEGEFDLTYLRALFRHAYRQGRMGKEWTGEFPGLKLAMPRL